jgi:hypothetical protein
LVRVSDVERAEEGVVSTIDGVWGMRVDQKVGSGPGWAHWARWRGYRRMLYLRRSMMRE